MKEVQSPAISGDRQDIQDNRRDSVETNVSHYEALSVLLKVSDKHASPTKFLANRFTIAPAGLTLDEFYTAIDAGCVRCIAAGAFTDLQIWETVSSSMKALHGSEISLHLVRKRLFNLYLRKIIIREKNSHQRYFLTPKWKPRIMTALEAK